MRGGEVSKVEKAAPYLRAALSVALFGEDDRVALAEVETLIRKYAVV